MLERDTTWGKFQIECPRRTVCRGVLLDIDGTLSSANSFQFLTNILNLSLDGLKEIYLKAQRQNFGNYADTNLVDFWTQTGKLSRNFVEKVFRQFYPLDQGAERVVAWLRQRLIPVALVTSGLDIFAQAIGERLMVEAYAGTTTLWDDGGYLTGIIRKTPMAERKYFDGACVSGFWGNVPMTECVAVGDGWVDRELLGSVGLGVVIGNETNEGMLPNHLRIDNIGDLIPLIQNKCVLIGNNQPATQLPLGI